MLCCCAVLRPLAMGGGRLKVPGVEGLLPIRDKRHGLANVLILSWPPRLNEASTGLKLYRLAVFAGASKRPEDNRAGRRASKNNGRPRVWLPRRPPPWPLGWERRGDRPT